MQSVLMIKCDKWVMSSVHTELGAQQCYSIRNAGSTLNLPSKVLPDKNSPTQDMSCHSRAILPEDWKNESSLWCWDDKTDLHDNFQQCKPNSAATVSDPGENKQPDPRTPQLAPRGSVGGLHCTKDNKVSFSKNVLPFKNNWKKYASCQSRRCMSSVLTLWKKALIPQLLINYNDHSLVLCAIRDEENTDAFQRGSWTQSFSLLRTFFSEQAPSRDTMRSETDLRQSTVYEQYCTSCLNTMFTGKAATGMETSKNKALLKLKKAKGKTNKEPGRFSEETKSNP